MRQLTQNAAFLFLLILVTIAFSLILHPFWAAIFWASVLAVIFFPLRARLLSHLGPRPNTAAFLTLLIASVIVVLPVLAIVASIVQRGIALVQRIDAGEISVAGVIERLRSAFPIVPDLLQNLGIDTSRLSERLADSAVAGSQLLAEETLSFGQDTFSFILSLGLMLYLAFFLLRDGEALVQTFSRALPLNEKHKARLFSKFAEVARATVKGNLLIAIVQGTLGGLIFWILGIAGPVLWGVAMAFLSLIPAIGAALIWLPVAVYLIATGDWIQGVILLAYGLIIIGLADNLLRPYLVGRDTRLPDYLVLFSTLGGLALFGLTGFVAGPIIAALFLVLWDIFLRDF